MKKIFTSVLLLAIYCTTAVAGDMRTYWQKVSENEIAVSGKRLLQPLKYSTYRFNNAEIKAFLFALPDAAETGGDLVLPLPDGSQRLFRVWQSNTMHPALKAKYPDIRTFTGFEQGHHNVTAKIEYTLQGFHAMIFDGANTYFIDPMTDKNEGYYICYYKQDYKKSDIEPAWRCGVANDNDVLLNDNDVLLNDNEAKLKPNVPSHSFKVNGETQKTYRLALACTREYAEAVAGANPTKPAVLSAMITSVNRVNGVYERELAVTLQLIANTDDLIQLAENDGYTNSNGPAMLNENQSKVNSVIGSANYDMGHVFSTGGGGIATPGVCSNFNKAKGVTGRPNPIGDPFDIDYVAHEMGHQFSGDHTFNANTDACINNGDPTTAYEPGSGSTILAYAGICGVNNIQGNSDAYFHYKTLDEIITYITTGTASNCPVETISPNTPSVTTAINLDFYIPYLTPFELNAVPATDLNQTELTYCWEQYDLGDFGANFTATVNGPIFRSFSPDTSTTRIFPRLQRILANSNSYLGEKVPTIERDMHFRLTVRDIFNGIGCVNMSDDDVTIHAVNTGVPFTVSSPNLGSDYWQAGATATVSWDVANTVAAPISCANVDILLSADSGYTYPYVLATGTANDGSETITVPNVIVTQGARVKVKGAGNVFFDLSNANFSINTFPVAIEEVNAADGIFLYPVPAKDVLHVEMYGVDAHIATVTNALGQSVWTGKTATQFDIQVGGWAAGVYNIRFTGQGNNVQWKRFVVD